MRAAPKPKRNKGVRDQTLDDLLRRYIRLISGGYCKRCKRYVGEKNIETAHMYRRHRKTVRWDLRNVYPLCPDCHRLVDNDSIELASFLYEVLSSGEIADLQKVANMTLKEYPIERAELKVELKEKIKKLGV